jgi:hypothetical protein
MFENLQIILCLIVGITLIYFGWLSSQSICEPRVEYRFIPRTFREESQNPVKVSEVFSDMFAKNSILF